MSVARVVLVVAGLWLATDAVPARQAQEPRFRTAASLVVVPVVVVDGKGQDVTTLRQEDFEVLEDGRPVVVETFVPPGSSEADTGRFIVVVVDNVNTPPELVWRTKVLARKIVDKMTPADQVAVIALAGGRASSSRSVEVLRQAIDRIAPSFGAEVHGPGRTATQGLESIAALAEQIAPARHRRKVLVLIGAAAMLGPNEPSAFDDRGPDLSPGWLAAVRQTAQQNVSFYVIDPSGFTGQVQDHATSFAASTGGVAWANTNEWDKAVDRLWRDSGVYYLLGYVPPITDQRAHVITVRVRAPGLTVRARRLRG